MRKSFTPVLLFFLAVSAVPAFASQKPLRLTASAVVGFDNNPELNAGREEDFFFQEALGVRYKQKLSDRIRLRVSADAVQVNYLDRTAADVTVLGAAGGLDVLIRRGTVLEIDHRLSYLDFPETNASSYLENRLRAGVRQRLGERFELRSGASVGVQDFTKRYIRIPDGHVSETEEREDMRYTADAEIAYLAAPGVLIKAGFAYFVNDSNDSFHDYYDYDGHRATGGISFPAGPRARGYANVFYERRLLDSRPLVDDRRTIEEDDLYGVSGGLFYDLRDGLALGWTCSYRQKMSNEPSQTYSGTLNTLGLYASF